MPHVIVKMLAGRTDAQKQAVADAITQALKDSLDTVATEVSVAIEDIGADEWTERVWRPDIEPHLDRLYKKPGYEPK